MIVRDEEIKARQKEEDRQTTEAMHTINKALEGLTSAQKRDIVAGLAALHGHSVKVQLG